MRCRSVPGSEGRRNRGIFNFRFVDGREGREAPWDESAVALPTVARQLQEVYEQRAVLDRTRIERVLSYANGGACYTAEILRYLDEIEIAQCQHCGNCAERTKRVVRRKAPRSSYIV